MLKTSNSPAIIIVFVIIGNVVTSPNERGLYDNNKSTPAQSSRENNDGTPKYQPKHGGRIGEKHVKTAEERLFAHLFSDATSITKRVRPVLKHETAVSVRLGVCLISLDEIIEKEQTMQSTGCIKLKWTNELLRWDPAQFDNLTWMVVPSSEIWLPDVALVNSPEPFVMTKQPASVELSHTGEIGYYPSGLIVTRCPIKLMYFPFDQQLCHWEFESWAYPVQAMEMLPWLKDPIETKSFVGNHLWLLTHTGISVSQSEYDGLNFSSIHFHYVFQRRSMYDTVFSVYPCLLMAMLQLISHTLPIEYEGRMGLLMALFIGSSVLLASISSTMPKSSDGISVFQFYLVIYSGSLIVSILETALYLHVFHRTPASKIPGLLRLIESFFNNFHTEEAEKRYANKLLEVEIEDMYKWKTDRASYRKMRFAQNGSRPTEVTSSGHSLPPALVSRKKRATSSDNPRQANQNEPQKHRKSESTFQQNGTVPLRNTFELLTRSNDYQLKNINKQKWNEGNYAVFIQPSTSSDSSLKKGEMLLPRQDSGVSFHMSTSCLLPHKIDTSSLTTVANATLGSTGEFNESSSCEIRKKKNPSVMQKSKSYAKENTPTAKSSNSLPNVVEEEDEEISWHSDFEESCSEGEADARLAQLLKFLKTRNAKYISRRKRAVRAAEVRAHRAVWLEFAARFDKIFFYSLAFVYFITPIVLFIVIPSFQEIPTAFATVLQPYNP